MVTGRLQRGQLYKFNLYPHGIVARVYLAGCFVGWRPLPMQRQEDGRFAISLWLEPGIYSYRFVVDGRMILDPRNQAVSLDSLGRMVSLLRLS